MTDKTGLHRLGQSSLRLANDERDIRNMTVVDANGDEIGRVDALYVDTAERRVRFLDVHDGGILGLGDTEYLVPVEAVADVTKDRVRLGHPRRHVTNAPRYDPELIRDRTYWTDVYGWYGYTPYWTGMATGMPAVR